MLNNIVDNIEQCGQHNIVQGCFHQPGTGCAFFAVYNLNIPDDHYYPLSNMIYLNVPQQFGVNYCHAYNWIVCATVFDTV